MTIQLGGEPTTLVAVPRHWRGPLPSMSAVRQLPDGGGYVRVPSSLLHAGFPDLGVLTWVWLYLAFEDRPGRTNYQQIATDLGLDQLSARAATKRLSLAVQPLLGSWIIQTKVGSNTYTYRAVNMAPNDRYAMIRRDDLQMLLDNQQGVRAKVSDIVDFGRWQLECGQRGWTAEPTRLVAERWKVTHPTIRQSRDRLAALGLLEVVHRRGSTRLSDLVWLKERFNPHWAIPNPAIEVVDETPTSSGLGWKDSGDSASVGGSRPGSFSGTGQAEPGSSLEDSGGLGWKSSGDSVGRFLGTPLEEVLTESLTDDLSELGGTSVPTLTLLSRKFGDAPPPASGSEDRGMDEGTADHRRTAARLMGQHRVLASAKPYFRTAMIGWITSALEQGLAVGHLDRALALVAEDAPLDAECLIVKRALRQAWIDQRVGMCADCGDTARHSPGCPRFDFSWAEEAAAATGSKHRPWGGGPRTAAADPLTLLLQRGVTDCPDEHDEAAVVDWMTVRLAQQIAAAGDREATLRAVWTRWRTVLPPGKRDLLDHANQHVRYALGIRRVS